MSGLARKWGFSVFLELVKVSNRDLCLVIVFDQAWLIDLE